MAAARLVIARLFGAVLLVNKSYLEIMKSLYGPPIDLTWRTLTSRARPTCIVNKSRTLPMRAQPEGHYVSIITFTVNTVRLTVSAVNGVM